MKRLVIIAHNLRSTHNVGSLLRTAEGLGISEVVLSGYTPHPSLVSGDPRLPHERMRITKQIQKTALGAEELLAWRREESIDTVLIELRGQDFTIAALEQAADAQPLNSYNPPDKLALILGREVEGLEPEVLAQCDRVLEIPMRGRKESFNVVQAAAMAMYHLTLSS